MSFSFDERPDSRAMRGNPPEWVWVYIATGEQDDETVWANAKALTPISKLHSSEGLLWRKDIRLRPAGFKQYIVTVPYGSLERDDPPQGNFTFTFDTQGATINIKAAKEHVSTYLAAGAKNANHKGAIGVKEGGEVEGVDIIIPALKFSYTYSHASGVVNETFARSLADATGKTNTDTWRTFSPGELLFIGGSGSDGTDAEASVTYNMIASNNETNLTIGDITGIAKNGHDVLWIEFEDDVDEGEPIRAPKRVHVDRVYDSISFSSTFGFS